METNRETITGKTKTEMVGRCVCDNLKVLNVRNWKELATDRKAWNDLSEKAKTHKGL
jgi:hypothetical protein